MATRRIVARSHACLSLHGLANKIVDPTFKEAALRYSDLANAAGQLIKKMKRGGGLSGAVPPNPHVREQDINAVLTRVLAQ